MRRDRKLKKSAQCQTDMPDAGLASSTAATVARASCAVHGNEKTGRFNQLTAGELPESPLGLSTEQVGK
jgi:hypothetical protein